MSGLDKITTPYKVTSENNAIRFVNFNDFVSRVSGVKKSKFSIITLVYNNTKYIRNIFEYLSHETEDFDLIVIDNCTKEEISNELESLCKGNGFNTIYLKPISDMGSAGGYSLGLEWSLAHGYQHVCILEDDVIILEQGVIDDYIRAIATQPSEDHLYFIQQCNGNIDVTHHRAGHSWYVFAACYPKKFLERCGVVDPRYFFRGEDIERGKRIEDTIAQCGYKKIIVDKHFFHPYMKKGNNSVFWIYFSLRNQFYTYHKHKSGLHQLMLTTMLYIQNGLINLCMGKIGILLSIYLAIKDHNTLHDVTLNFSQKKEDALRQYSSFRLKRIADKRIPLADIPNMISDAFMIFPHYQFDSIDIDYLKENIKKGWKNLLVGGMRGPMNALFLCFPRIITIDETDYKNGYVLTSVIRNNWFILYIILNILCVIPALLLTIIAYFSIIVTKR